jgi:hypothetical protein
MEKKAGGKNRQRQETETENGRRESVRCKAEGVRGEAEGEEERDGRRKVKDGRQERIVSRSGSRTTTGMMTSHTTSGPPGGTQQ